MLEEVVGRPAARTVTCTSYTPVERQNMAIMHIMHKLHQSSAKHVLHANSLRMLKEAPKNLNRQAKLYQDCLARLAKQDRQHRLAHSADEQTETTRHRNQCLQELTELAKRIDPLNPEAGETVIFEIKHGGQIESGCVGFYLPSIVVIFNREHVVAQAPRWVHTLIRELSDWEGGAKEYETAWMSPIRIGKIHPAPTPAALLDASVLWDPHSDGPFEKFADAIAAVKLLI